MTRFAFIVAAFGMLLTFSAVGCQSASSEPPAATPADGARVEVPAEGKKFDPAVTKEQVPDGAWICDMGTVHYARGEKGDGKCPVCGMMLVEHKH